MKKVLSLVLSLMLVMSLFTACSSKNDAKDPAPTEKATAEAVPTEEATEPDTATGTVKTGLAVISSIEKSADVGEEDGLAQMDSTVVAVTVDEAGKIVACKINAAQTKVNFTAKGEITTDLATVFVSKQELGTEYGMSKASSIKKEWNEEATALADYVVGKTVEEVKGIAVTEEGVPTDADLAASVTIKIGGYVAAIEKAVANATDLGASATDTLGLALTTNIAKSKNAAEEDGLAQAYSTYVVTTSDADGKITSCIIDGSQSNVNFSKEGKITSDLTAELKTKNELGTGYGLAKASGIKKEWNEQAAAFATYVVGKTVEEVKGIALTEGVPSAEDLTASVTVHVADFVTLIEKASVK